jgi:hypothetical protein
VVVGRTYLLKFMGRIVCSSKQMQETNLNPYEELRPQTIAENQKHLDVALQSAQ